MIDKLDFKKLSKLEKSTPIKIGQLTQDVIDRLSLTRTPCDIILWSDRVEYTQKHIKDFESEDDYYKHMSTIPTIVQNPDYVGLHPKDNSIQYVKRIDEIMLAGIRLKDTGSIIFRSSYPITQGKLNNYINSGRLVKL